MSHRVTIQQIARELGLSRNTVSKALNNTGVLAPATQKRIIDKAIEMGYKQFAENLAMLSELQVNTEKEIALLTYSMPTGSHFGSRMLTGFERVISQNGYRLVIYAIKDNNLHDLTLPVNFNRNSATALICVEMFDAQYNKMVCGLNYPTLFVDTSPLGGSIASNADLLMMENQSSVYQMVNTLIAHGKATFGYIGEILHCRSFYERWVGCCNAVYDAGLPHPAPFSIIEADREPYRDPVWLSQKIRALHTIPEVFVCANDFLAIATIRALKVLKKNVPEDICVCGFDDTPEAGLIDPSLTSVHVQAEGMGEIAAELLLSRIKNGTLPNRIMYVQTQPVYRTSTSAR